MANPLVRATVNQALSSVSTLWFLEGEKATARKELLMTYSYLIQVSELLYLMTDFRETLLVLAKSRQTKASAAKDGSQQSVVERFPNHYLWRLEWISSTLRCHLY